jgi:hypothetical protein
LVSERANLAGPTTLVNATVAEEPVCFENFPFTSVEISVPLSSGFVSLLEEFSKVPWNSGKCFDGLPVTFQLRVTSEFRFRLFVRYDFRVQFLGVGTVVFSRGCEQQWFLTLFQPQPPLTEPKWEVPFVLRKGIRLS